jgi:hypothetical protein
MCEYMGFHSICAIIIKVYIYMYKQYHAIFMITSVQLQLWEPPTVTQVLPNQRSEQQLKRS